IRNLGRWQAFNENVRTGQPDAVQVVQYTVEGAPIFSQLAFNNGRIRHRYDNRMDPYGSPMQRFEFCGSIEEQDIDHGKRYTLDDCESPSHFQLLIPAEAELQWNASAGTAAPGGSASGSS